MRLKQKLKNWLLVMRLYAHTKRAVFITYLILRFFVLAGLVLALINGDYDSAFICVLVLFLFLVPAFLQDKFSLEFPTLLEIIILVFIFAAEILGELSNYYVHFAYWDTLLHTTWGFLCAAVGFSLVDLLNSSEKIKLQLSPLYLAICAFCFSMTIGVIWEFFEFCADILLHTDMQKDTVINTITSVSLDPTNSNIPITISDINDVYVNGQSLGLGGYLDIGLYDTMEDLFVNFIGALVFSIIGCLDIKCKGRLLIAHSFIPRVKKRKKTAYVAPKQERTDGNEQNNNDQP